MRLFSAAIAQPRPELLLLISLAISPLPFLGSCLAPPSFDKVSQHTSAARLFGQQQQQQFQQQEPVFETDGQRAGDYEQGSERVDDDDDDDDGWVDWLKEKYVVRDPFDEDFDQMVEETLEHWHVPGLSVAVVHGDYTFAKGYGKAILPDVPATPETLYYVGSTTKSFTAAAILLLIEDAQLQANNSATPQTLPPDLSLTTPVSTLIRDDFVLPDTYATSKATLEDLLTHRTGMPRHDLSLPATGRTLRDHVANLRHLPLTADLRSAWQYCNMMYLALAHVLEQLTSTTWSEFVRARLWAPLSMPHTYASLTEARAQAPHLLSAPYFWHNATRSYIREPYLPPSSAALTGAGNVLSCVADYATYLRALLKRRPNPFASQDPFRQLRRAARAVVADPADSDDEEERGGKNAPWTGPTLYGLGWMAQTYRVGGLRVYTHDGAVTGYAASMAYAPEAGWGVAVMANTEVRGNWAAERVVVRLVEGLVGTPVGERWDALEVFDGHWEKVRKNREGARDVLFPGAPRGRGDEGWVPLGLPLERYAGAYVNEGYGNFTFVVEEGHAASPFGNDDEDVGGVADDATTRRRRRRHLHASVKDKLWAFGLCLEHVSGEFFMAWQGAVEEMPNGLFEDEMPFKARFEVGVSGKVERLHLAMEPKMGEDMIVFTRVDE